MSAQNDAPCGTEKCPPEMVCKSPFCRAQQPAQGEAVGHLYRLIVEGQVVGARYMDGPKLFGVFGKPGRDHGGKETATALYAAPPAPVVPDARPIESWMSDKTAYENYGWNACRAAMLAAAPEVKP